MKTVTIHSDGACEGNPGPGGWAAVLRHGEHCREISGGEPATTNNRMELQAAISGLTVLKVPCEVAFYTDSEYLRNGITKWVAGWKRTGWRTADKKPVRNEDLWRELDVQTARHRVAWHWLKGHAGHADNERCDLLARQEIARIRKQYSKADLKARLERFLEERGGSGNPSSAA
jgi:ribonuclease HI